MLPLASFLTAKPIIWWPSGIFTSFPLNDAGKSSEKIQLQSIFLPSFPRKEIDLYLLYESDFSSEHLMVDICSDSLKKAIGVFFPSNFPNVIGFVSPWKINLIPQVYFCPFTSFPSNQNSFKLKLFIAKSFAQSPVDGHS